MRELEAFFAKIFSRKNKLKREVVDPLLKARIKQIQESPPSTIEQSPITDDPESLKFYPIEQHRAPEWAKPKSERISIRRRR
ncbi:MAG: hypothetical protein ACLP8A_17315 [Methylovirgula sp.]